MNMYKNIYLKRGKDSSILRFHPWIFSGAIAGMEKGIAEGDTVRVLDSENRFLAVGHFQVGSIAVRILSFQDVELDENFLESRLQSAIDMRLNLNLVREDNTAFRLVHGEGDGLPALIVDVYGRTAVIQAHSIGMHLWRKTIAAVLH